MKFTNKNVFESAQFKISPEACLIQRKKTSMQPIIVDLRSADDYAEKHLIGAHSLPGEYLKDYIQQIPPYAKVIVYGDGDDEKTLQSVRLLYESSFSDLHYVPGGYPALMETLKSSKDEVFLENISEADWATKIEQVLDDDVRPMLASDGGGLTVSKIEGHQVYINYEGACAGCSSSQTGTLSFIKNALSIALNYDIEVISL